MAEALQNVERVVTTTVKYTLTLSAEEAETIGAVLAHVGGDRETSARKHTQSVLLALEGAGVVWYGRKIESSINGHLKATEQ